jgi:hypothetical protein
MGLAWSKSYILLLSTVSYISYWFSGVRYFLICGVCSYGCGSTSILTICSTLSNSLSGCPSSLIMCSRIIIIFRVYQL